MAVKRSRTRPDLARHTPGGRGAPQRARVRTDLPRFTPGGGLNHAALAQRVFESEDTERLVTAATPRRTTAPSSATGQRRLRVTLPAVLVEALRARADDERRSVSALLTKAAVLWLEVTQS